jgi:hypothetical protein
MPPASPRWTGVTQSHGVPSYDVPNPGPAGVDGGAPRFMLLRRHSRKFLQGKFLNYRSIGPFSHRTDEFDNCTAADSEGQSSTMPIDTSCLNTFRIPREGSALLFSYI